MSAVLSPTQNMDRSTYIGSSDAAAIMGVSKWRTPLDVYLSKIDPRKENFADPDRARILRRGHRLEPYIVQMGIDALRDRGHQVLLVAQGRRYIHPDHPFLAAEIDAELMVDGEHVNYEAKSVNRRNFDEWGEEGSADIPMYYAAQVCLAQAITGRRKTYVGAVFGLDDFVPYILPADDELNSIIVQKCVGFWRDHIVPRVPPAPETLLDIAHLYRNSGPPPIEATDEILLAAQRLKQLRDEAKRANEIAEEAEFNILAFMGVSDTLTRDGHKVLSAKHQVRMLVDSKRLAREQQAIFDQYRRPTVSRPILFSRSKK